MVQTNGSSSITPEASSFLKLDTVPCVLDNKPWEGLSKTYDLKDPHSAEGKVLVGLLPSLDFSLSLFPLHCTLHSVEKRRTSAGCSERELERSHGYSLRGVAPHHCEIPLGASFIIR